MESIIYALVDPKDHRVKYIGQCHDMHVRLQGHMSLARSGSMKPVYQWMRSLLPSAPLVVELEVITRRRVAGNLMGLSSVMEAKWLKRFRRTVLNDKANGCAAFDDFVNPPEVTRRYYRTEEAE